jgi:D-beta-D-heptose 7-phosphate kinase/D-beta-D-heptose 1-phosphate adenosyltransferase
VQLLDRMKSRRITVVGDVMLDRYLVGDTDRLSPEAPVPVVTIRETRSALGGAANVGANVAAIGASCRLVGAVGDDSHGTAIRAELAAARMDDRHLVALSGRPTTTKSRVMARGQQVVRIDEEVETPVEGQDQERLISTALAALVDADAVVLEDYNKGALTAPLIESVIAAARRRGIPVVVDPKFRNFFSYGGATVFKPNRRELEAALGATLDLEQENALQEALARLKVDNLLLTLGPDGMVLVTKDQALTHIASLARAVYDVSGAGDTVTAWVAVALAAGATVREAAHVANYAAGLEVGKPGVATVSPDEVLLIHEERHDAIGRLRRGGVI